MDYTGRALAFDTASEMLALSCGTVGEDGLEIVAKADATAPRQANQVLALRIKDLLESCSWQVTDLDFIIVGRGPGSFTGVRIGIATAKGLSCGLGKPVYGVSTLDAIAWKAWREGVRGMLGVVEDAMRKEIYPVRYRLGEKGIERLDVDKVAKPAETAAAWAQSKDELLLVGDGLRKHAACFEQGPFTIGDESLWTPDGEGLFQAFVADAAAERLGAGDPALLLPVYTRLSDAEENERKRLALKDEMPKSGVADQRAVGGLFLHPMSVNDVADAVKLQELAMPQDAWTYGKLADEIGREDRSWWIARKDGTVIGCAGGQVVSGELCIFSVCVDPAWRGRGVATRLLERVATDGRALGAETVTLEVRTDNEVAISLYHALGLEDVGVRPHYYHDRADALIMRGNLPLRMAHPARANGQLGSACGDPSSALPECSDSPAHTDVPLARPARAELASCNAEEGGIRGASGSVGASVQGVSGPVGASSCSPYRAQRDDAAAILHDPPAGPVGASSCSPYRAQRDDAAAVACDPPVILAIESSCDETACSIVDGKRRVLADTIASQIDFHSRFGGVVPEIASRKHTEAIVTTTMDTLAQAGMNWDDLSAIAVTQGPGLVGALVVGVAFAKGVCLATGLPFIGVNHLEGHLYANRYIDRELTPPFVALLVSGGHTMLVHVKDWGNYEVLGSTLDDAVGEAFDKVAKALGLGYPGGPIISRFAAQGDPKAIDFPRAMLHSGDLSFSLSGLKTAVVTYIDKLNRKGEAVNIPNLAASFQAAVVDVQVAKALTACEQCGVDVLCIGGGVAANPALRTGLLAGLGKHGIRVIMPDASECTDNASMIAAVALDLFEEGAFGDLSEDPIAHMPLRKKDTQKP